MTSSREQPLLVNIADGIESELILGKPLKSLNVIEICFTAGVSSNVLIFHLMVLNL